MQQTPQGTHIRVLALFDLDHTLIDVDSDYLWGKYIVKQKLVDRNYYGIANQKYYQEYIEGTLDATEYNEFVAQFLGLLSMEKLQELRDEFIRTHIQPFIRPKALIALNKHLQMNHDVVITSATNDFLVVAIAEVFGILPANILATPLEMKEGRYTGKLKDKPNFKEGKIYHLEKWLDVQQAQGIRYSKTYAYSDSKNDIPLLQWADTAICITPDDSLHSYALSNQWVIEDWSL